MPIFDPNGTHNHYTETNRHFVPHSEIYTGADSLITAQQSGWRLINIAYEEILQLRGGHYTSLYYFKLVCGSEKMIMPVVANPFVAQMLNRLKILVLAFPNRAENLVYERE